MCLPCFTPPWSYLAIPRVTETQWHQGIKEEWVDYRFEHRAEDKDWKQYSFDVGALPRIGWAGVLFGGGEGVVFCGSLLVVGQVW